MGRSLAPYLLLVPTAVILIIFVFIPLGFGIYYSFTRYVLTQSLTPLFQGLVNYRLLFLTLWPTFSSTIDNTVVWLIISLPAGYLVALMVAMILNQKWLIGKWFFRSVLLIAWAAPWVATGINWRLMLDPQIGIITQVLTQIGLGTVEKPVLFLASAPLPTLILISIWKSYPFGAIILLAVLQSIPKQLYDAASVDGASRWSLFRHVEWPHLMNMNVVLWLFGIIGTINVFDVIWVTTMGGPGTATSTVVVFAFVQAFQYYNIGLGSAVSTLLFILEITIAAFYIKYIIRRRSSR